MEKKWFVALLMVVVMVCACWTGAVAEDEERETFTVGDYEYALLDDGTVEITGYNGKAEKLTIPNMLNGKKVTSIGDNAFSGCSFLISITIPDSVTSIGDSVFYRSSLTSVTIPDSVAQIGVNPFECCYALNGISVSLEQPYFAAIDGVLFRKADKALISYPARKSSSTYTIPQGITTIGDSAFSYCKSLMSVTIPDSVTSIGDSAFFCCDSLISVAIPDSVISIGDSAFSCCKSLTSITIPDSVTSIGDSAFSDCDSLTSITIPDFVTQIGVNPFVFCSSLKSISVSPDHPYFAVIDDVLFRKADKTLISYPEGKASSTYTIPQGIISIGDGAFFDNSSLKSITIPDSVTSIGDSAFYYCKSLTSVSIPDSVTSIGNATFKYCNSLTSVTIPDSVTSIGDWAFSGCDSLTTVTIPDSVTFIGKYAFDNCPDLVLTVPRSSYAAEYAKANNIPYTYPDANDWLNN